MSESSAAARSRLASRAELNSTLATISKRVVGLLKEAQGKGPTKARTYFWGDLVVVLLSGGLTTAESTLWEGGRRQTVIDQRSQMQEVLRPRLTQVIEEELRREVVAFMSANHVDPDFHAEMFVLSPEAEQDDADRASPAGAGDAA
ncbi:MAG: Na-translocating system protein MpsC family protein [Solirubrobacteraceae bacterium]